MSRPCRRTIKPCCRPVQAMAAQQQGGLPGLAGILQAIQAQMQGQAASGEPPRADVEVKQLTYHPAGGFTVRPPSAGWHSASSRMAPC